MAAMGASPLVIQGEGRRLSNVMGVGGSVMDVGGLFGREADRTKNVVGREERRQSRSFNMK